MCCSTNQEIDRQALDLEFGQLKDEINQISEQTTFNDMNLLDGSLGAGGREITFGGTDALGTLTVGSAFATNATVNKVLVGTNVTKEGTFTFETGSIDATGAFKAGTTGGTDNILRVTFTDTDGNSTIQNLTIDEIFTNATTGAGVNALTANSTVNMDLTAVGLGKYEIVSAATATDSDALVGALNAMTATVGAPAAGGVGGQLSIQVGAKTGETMDINISAINTTTLAIDALDIGTQAAASTAIDTVREAVNTVSSQRARLGAAQNRLEHKIANLNTSAENLSAAESRIRDVDLASEMTSFTKNNILSQAATAMLAQANTIPQNVLQLLR